MRRGVVGLLCLCLAGCAIAFTPGEAPAPPPAKFVDHDTEKLARDEEKKTEEAVAGSTPAFGMSLVVGGSPMDAGGLPKPPIPVVLLP
jgi:hypothetical protein